MAGSLVNKNSKYRPKIQIPVSKIEIVLEIFAFCGVLAILSYSFAYWSKLPDMVPTHFNFTGEADAWGAKSSILLMPAIVVILHIILTMVSRFPHLFNYPVRITEENARQEYILGRYFLKVLKLLIVWMFFFISRFTISIALGEKTNLGNIMWVMMVTMFVILVGYFIFAFKLAKKKA